MLGNMGNNSWQQLFDRRSVMPRHRLRAKEGCHVPVSPRLAPGVLFQVNRSSPPQGGLSAGERGDDCHPHGQRRASANHIGLGQVVVDEKSNEITAIPKLLRILELSGCLVTIDAMGCQVEIARAIVEAKADYVLAVKDNGPRFAQGIDAFFVDHAEDDFARVETRRHVAEERRRQLQQPSRRAALSLLKNNHSKKVGVKNKRLLAALDEDYLLEVLLGQ